MRIMLVIAFCLCFGGLCFAEELVTKVPNPELDALLKPAEPTEISITHEEQLTIENLQLKLQILQGQIELVRGQLDSTVKELVAKYRIDPQSWSYDAQGGKFVRIKQAVKE